MFGFEAIYTITTQKVRKENVLGLGVSKKCLTKAFLRNELR